MFNLPSFKGIEGKAALFLLISALLHLVYFLISGFQEISMLVFGLVYIIFAYGIARPIRWLGYFVFVLMLMGAVLAYAISGSGVLGLIALTIMIADMAVAMCLFLYLWRDKRALKR